MWKLTYTKETFPHSQHQLLAMGVVPLAAEPPFQENFRVINSPVKQMSECDIIENPESEIV